jgi:hypothetical protein
MQLSSLFSNVDILKIIQKSKDLYKPNNYSNYDYDIKDPPDFTIHGDVVVHQPEKNPGDNQYYQNSEK